VSKHNDAILLDESLVMLSGKLTVALAMVLAFGQLQCAAVCTVSTCDLTQMNGGGSQDAPPCHRHNGDSSKHSPGQCPHGIVTANAADLSPAQAHPAPLAIAILTVRAEVNPRLLPAGDEFAVLHTAPPGSSGPSTLVLRI
jgi:hypothetical protein